MLHPQFKGSGRVDPRSLMYPANPMLAGYAPFIPPMLNYGTSMNHSEPIFDATISHHYDHQQAQLIMPTSSHQPSTSLGKRSFEETEIENRDEVEIVDAPAPSNNQEPQAELVVEVITVDKGTSACAWDGGCTTRLTGCKRKYVLDHLRTRHQFKGRTTPTDSNEPKVRCLWMTNGVQCPESLVYASFAQHITCTHYDNTPVYSCSLCLDAASTYTRPDPVNRHIDRCRKIEDLVAKGTIVWVKKKGVLVQWSAKGNKKSGGGSAKKLKTN